MRKLNINFFGMRWVFFSLSAVLLLVSAGSLAINGLNFGIEFQGGSTITIPDAAGATDDQVEAAFSDAGLPDVQVQSSLDAAGVEGFIVRTTDSDTGSVNDLSAAAADALALDVNSFSVSVIGAGWGARLTESALTALALSILAIIAYISIRFEWKMSLTAVLALVHDLFITVGIYSLMGAEVSTATIAALLSILGYSLYDTVIVFSRIKENTDGIARMSFHDMANMSINEVFVRSVNTGLTSVIPVVVMLIMNVESLNGFAMALVIGQLVGAYSSIGIASPLYAMWKEREPKFAKLRDKYATEGQK